MAPAKSNQPLSSPAWMLNDQNWNEAVVPDRSFERRVLSVAAIQPLLNRHRWTTEVGPVAGWQLKKWKLREADFEKADGKFHELIEAASTQFGQSRIISRRQVHSRHGAQRPLPVLRFL